MYVKLTAKAETDFLEGTEVLFEDKMVRRRMTVDEYENLRDCRTPAEHFWGVAALTNQVCMKWRFLSQFNVEFTDEGLI